MATFKPQPKPAAVKVPEKKVRGADGAQIDTSLWSQKRIDDFKQAISLDSSPPVAVMRVRRLNIEAPVYPGTDELTLNRGVGWIEGTPAPGSRGNSGLAAHRDGFFRGLKDIAVGDVIELTTEKGPQKFVVRDLKIVTPSDVSVLAPTAEPTLTLVTCYPFYFIGSAPKRFIVRAVGG